MKSTIAIIGVFSFVIGILCKLSLSNDYVFFYMMGVMCLCTLAILEKGKE